MLAVDPYPNAHEALADTLAHATADDWAAGLQWYQLAHAHACELGETYGRDPIAVAGMIAATSPQLSWDQNLIAVDALLAGERNVCLGLGEARALRIAAGEDPRTVLGGRKVRSFFLNVAYPEYAGPVTVDRHAIAILCGMTTPETNRRHGRYLERPGAYVHAAAHYRAAARTYNVRPHELQAVAWVTHRMRTDTPDPGDF